MKRFLTILTAVLLLEPLYVFAQDQNYVAPTVMISNEKVKINGKLCYSHVVLEKQTLYSISKAYGVSVDDIYQVNPGLKENGLKKNSIILIPVIASSTEKTAVTDASSEVTPTSEAAPAGNKIHVVKWYEDLKSIARKYSVSIDDIKAANKLSGNKLKARQELIIPIGGVPPVSEEKSKPTETDASTLPVVMETVDNETPVQRDTAELIITPKKNLRAALILPFNAGDKANHNCFDFYSGVLMAVNSLAEQGIHTDLNVIDLSNESPSCNEIAHSDVVLGPIAPKDINAVLNIAGGRGMIVSPLDSRSESLAMTNRNFISAPSSHIVQYRDLVNWIKSDMAAEDRVIIISEKSSRDLALVNCFKAMADSSGVQYSSFSYNILEGRKAIEPLSKLMSETATNRVLIASESEAFVNDVVRNLNLMIYNKFDVVLYAHSKIRSFETIEVENFHKTGLHLCSAYFIDYNDEKLSDFLLKYRALYNMEPSQFAYAGYDIAYYFLSLIARYGDDWTAFIESEHASMFQSAFRFKRIENGGWINEGTKKAVYTSGWEVMPL